jgi:hypothetical protein
VPGRAWPAGRQAGTPWWHARRQASGLSTSIAPLPVSLPAVHGYNVGELAACRRFAEAAAELRVPLLGQQVFAFAEYGSDLGSSGQCSTHTACQHLLAPWAACLSKPGSGVGALSPHGWLAGWLVGRLAGIPTSVARPHPPTHPLISPPTHPPTPAPAGEVRGNPTEYYRRIGSGSSYGAGIKVGAIQAEAVRDNNAGKWHAFLAYGERF